MESQQLELLHRLHKPENVRFVEQNDELLILHAIHTKVKIDRLDAKSVSTVMISWPGQAGASLHDFDDTWPLTRAASMFERLHVL